MTSKAMGTWKQAALFGSDQYSGILLVACGHEHWKKSLCLSVKFLKGNVNGMGCEVARCTRGL